MNTIEKHHPVAFYPNAQQILINARTKSVNCCLLRQSRRWATCRLNALRGVSFECLMTPIKLFHGCHWGVATRRVGSWFASSFLNTDNVSLEWVSGKTFGRSSSIAVDGKQFQFHSKLKEKSKFIMCEGCGKSYDICFCNLIVCRCLFDCNKFHILLLHIKSKSQARGLRVRRVHDQSSN